MDRKAGSFSETYKFLLTAVAGVVAGIVIAGSVFIGSLGTEKTWELFAPASKPVPVPAEAALRNKNQELISILEAIIRGEPGLHRSADSGDGPGYEGCVNQCRKEFPGTDMQSKTLLLDCTKECLLQYSAVMKGIHERFYRSETSP